MIDPCLPALHSPATLHAWKVWRLAHPWWKPAAIVAGCASAAAVPFAVFYPYAAPPAAIAAPLQPPPPSPGSAGQGFYVPSYVPPREGSEFSPYVPSGETSPIPTGFSPPQGETLPPFPPTTVGSAPPRTDVSEPASLAVLAVGAVGAVLMRRRRG